MKTSADGKNKQLVAIGLMVVAVLCVAWAFMSMSGSSGSEDVAATTTGPKGKTEKMESLDPRLQLGLLANSESVKYEGRGKNIFTDAPEPVTIPKVQVSPVLSQQQREQEARAAVYVPPPPPPINLKYFGITSSKGERPRAFLSQGDDVWIAHEGDVVNRHYRILRISPNSVEIEDLLNNNRQNIRLSEG